MSFTSAARRFPVSRQFLLFLVSGGLAAVLNWGSRFFFSLWAPFEAAVVLAFLVGLFSGFLLMRCFVFHATDKPLVPQFATYVLVNLLALLQTFLISVALVRWGLPMLGVDLHAEAIGHLVGVLVPVATSYLGHRLATFR